jgi:hypothetical protein
MVIPRVALYRTLVYLNRRLRSQAGGRSIFHHDEDRERFRASVVVRLSGEEANNDAIAAES